MKSTAWTMPVAVLLCGTLLLSSPAHALRCGGKLVLEGMLEIEVRKHCGEPTAIRERGFVVRSFTPFELIRSRDAHGVRFGPGNFYQHLLITEFIYNFGPSRLMRKLRFEGGLLTDIETLGYGYYDDEREDEE
jgi:hypothetical protein